MVIESFQAIKGNAYPGKWFPWKGSRVEADLTRKEWNK
jgi:hypothetical protein